MNGIRWVNDSKATTVSAAVRALAAYADEPVRLIAGGRGKGQSFEPLGAALGPNVKAVYLIGEAAPEIAAAAGSRAVVVGDLASAVERAAAEAEPGDVVAALAGLRELRPVQGFRPPRRGVPPAGAEPGGVKRAQLESNVLVLVTLALTAFGLVMVYSATSARAVDGGNGRPMEYLLRQALFAGLGLVALLLAARTPYAFWRRIAPSFLLVSLVLLAGVLLVGQSVNGARRWVPLGPFAFQPSELAKLALAAWVAAYLARPRRRQPASLTELAKPLGLVAGLACVLILVEPDLGTAVSIVVMLVGILVVAGLPSGLLVRAFAIVAAAGALAIWLEPYRRTRFFAFLDPWHDPQGAGFQIVQAMIGLGSGGWLGVGIGHGVVKVFDLPEAHTDMIFATVGEELGLVGTGRGDLRLCGLRVGRLPHRPRVQGPVREAARGRTDRADLRPGRDQPRRRPGDRAADGDHAALRLLRRLEPDCSARRDGDPP